MFVYFFIIIYVYKKPSLAVHIECFLLFYQFYKIFEMKIYLDFTFKNCNEFGMNN